MSRRHDETDAERAERLAAEAAIMKVLFPLMPTPDDVLARVLVPTGPSLFDRVVHFLRELDLTLSLPIALEAGTTPIAVPRENYGGEHVEEIVTNLLYLSLERRGADVRLFVEAKSPPPTLLESLAIGDAEGNPLQTVKTGDIGPTGIVDLALGRVDPTADLVRVLIATTDRGTEQVVLRVRWLTKAPSR